MLAEKIEKLNTQIKEFQKDLQVEVEYFTAMRNKKKLLNIRGRKE